MCGSRSVRRQLVDVHLRSGKIVRDVEADVCPRCGERYYDLDAVQQIEKAWIKRSSRRRTAE